MLYASLAIDVSVEFDWTKVAGYEYLWCVRRKNAIGQFLGATIPKMNVSDETDSENTFYICTKHRKFNNFHGKIQILH